MRVAVEPDINFRLLLNCKNAIFKPTSKVTVLIKWVEKCPVRFSSVRWHVDLVIKQCQALLLHNRWYISVGTRLIDISTAWPATYGTCLVGAMVGRTETDQPRQAHSSVRHATDDGVGAQEHIHQHAFVVAGAQGILKELLSLKAPDHTMVWKRLVREKVAPSALPRVVFIAIDSSGFSTTLHGERMCDCRHRRSGFVKMHVVVDVETIVALTPA